jgi:type I restriction enzyme S subunit
MTPLASLCELIVDCEHKTAPTQQTGFPSIRTPNIGRGFFILDNVNRVSESTYVEWTDRATPIPGDLILAREAPVGNVAVIPEGEQFCLGQRTVLIRVNQHKVVPEYLCYLLLTPSMQGLLAGKSGGATVHHLNMRDIRSLPIPSLPSLVEQRRVSSVIKAYDDLIATNQRRIQLLEDAARRLYREWFVHLRFPGYESVSIRDGVPEGWRKVPLGDLAHLNYGKALKASERKDGQVPVYGSSGVVGHHDRAIVDAGAIIVGRKGNVGSLYFSQVPCFPIDTVFFISPDQASYLLFLALHQLTFNSSDAAVPGLNRSYAISLPITWPDTATRERFEAHASPLFKQIRTLTDANIELAKARDLLLPKLMSGQLDVSRITHKEVPI